MIQTVTGEIKGKELGTVLMHEHISCASLSFCAAFGEKWFDRERVKALSVETLKKMKAERGLGLFVDATPIDVGRDVLLLKAVSEKSGVSIVASSGFYSLESIEMQNNGAEELAGLLLDECKNGVRDTGIKPGILKCATGSVGITDDNHKKLSLMGIVQRESGLPLYIHCEHSGDIALKQLEILKGSGASAEKLIIGHAALRPDTDYLSEILKSGVYICMDQCFCYPDRLNDIAVALATLCERGYGERILLSNDYCVHNDFCPRAKNGLHLNAEQHTRGFSYILDEQYRAFLSVGGKEKDFFTMLSKNSVSVLDV